MARADDDRYAGRDETLRGRLRLAANRVDGHADGRIKANGGKILNGPNEVPGGARVLSATDPQGAAFGLHSKAA